MPAADAIAFRPQARVRLFHRRQGIEMTKLAIVKKKKYAVLLCLISALHASLLGIAKAGGFSESYQFSAGPGGASASAGGSSTFESTAGNYSSEIFANASVQETASGFAASAAGGNGTTASAGQGGITTSSDSTTTIFTKGNNALVKSRTETLTEITINGRTYLVAKEVAIAVARGTEFGVSAAALYEGSALGNAYSQTQVTSTKGTR